MKPPRWEELQQNVQLEFLLGGKAKMEDWYFDNTVPEKHQFSFEEFARRIKAREVNYYGETDTWLYEALDLCPINGVEVAIMGSTIPWYETIVLEYGGKPVTIDYNLPGYKHPQIEEVTLQGFWQNPRQFDVALSISSFEHDGLGRYGDPINPSGDLRAMSEMKKVVKKDGLLFLAVPIGKDTVVWNAHRIYGNIRFPMLIDGWTLEGCVGMEDAYLNRDMGRAGIYQPIIVLRNT